MYSLKRLSAFKPEAPDYTQLNSPLFNAGIGGTSSFAASSFARVDKCDSEKLRNFSMLKRFVRAFSGCTGGETGRSAESVVLERREAGIAYSLVGRGEVGGRSVVALAGGVCSSWSERWLAASGFWVETMSRTLRRRSRGMAGMRNYYYGRDNGHWAEAGGWSTGRRCWKALARSVHSSDGMVTVAGGRGVCETGAESGERRAVSLIASRWTCAVGGSWSGLRRTCV